MGYSSTTREDLNQRAAYRQASGTTFAHTATMASTPRSQQRAHESVDPKRLNKAGEKIRECRDSDAHPLTRGVMIGFDQTGSMGDGPRIIQNKLGSLKGSLLRAGLDHIQLCFACYGDAQNHEAAPLQVGQFEAGLEMEDWLNNLFLEGNGGGNGGETSGLLLYFMATHSGLDSLAKRGEKGLLFLIGDESPMPMVTRHEISTYVDDSVETDYSIEQVVAMVRQSYDVYFLHVKTGSAVYQDSLAVWQRLLGEDNVISVEDLNNISELVAMIVTRLEGAADSIDDVARMLVAEGASSTDVTKAGQALARFDRRVGNTAVATTTGSLPDTDTSHTTKRL